MHVAAAGRSIIGRTARCAAIAISLQIHERHDCQARRREVRHVVHSVIGGTSIGPTTTCCGLGAPPVCATNASHLPFGEIRDCHVGPRALEDDLLRPVAEERSRLHSQSDVASLVYALTSTERPSRTPSVGTSSGVAFAMDSTGVLCCRPATFTVVAGVQRVRREYAAREARRSRVARTVDNIYVLLRPSVWPWWRSRWSARRKRLITARTSASSVDGSAT